MPYSMVVAEPAGLIAGVIVGRVGGHLGRFIAEECGLPTWFGGMLGAAGCHYLSAALTKLIINAGTADMAGAAANVAFTRSVLE
ncbi:hypothetical protein [Myxococcus sp. RHSTA-1-4]|uniref:hypothetical protein n=1 Tax=Myxococcus sp. RHSTA-1-4 TaxID=2874601 RepID=UPI001CBED598|nr:hypothetical protein [Myxococcus sp. RHSTA-1-4]MBZ4421693.1 hypothetical protein [Myxococcus sp. RHSTA-1-4]